MNLSLFGVGGGDVLQCSVILIHIETLIGIWDHDLLKLLFALVCGGESLSTRNLLHHDDSTRFSSLRPNMSVYIMLE